MDRSCGKITAGYAFRNYAINLEQTANGSEENGDMDDEKEICEFYSVLLDNLIEENESRSCSYFEFIDSLFSGSVALASWNPNWKTVMRGYPSLFRSAFFLTDRDGTADWVLFWGTQFREIGNRAVLRKALLHKKNFAFTEMGFLNRIAWPHKDTRYGQSCSFVFDDICPYYDARFPSRLECLLNNKSLVLSEDQILRAKQCMQVICEMNLTKYNHQPIFSPQIGQFGKPKILVVDQVKDDMSVLKGFANEETFHEMLNSAIAEHPDADIIIKTHPDIYAANYYKNVALRPNVYFMDKPINPISLIKYCDEVYVCTSQLGFEALMCEKTVHVFGMPFYAGWGVTDDRQKCDRRKNHRSLEEIFYITYIMYSYYINPEKQKRCEIEEAIDYLLSLRNEYLLESV